VRVIKSAMFEGLRSNSAIGVPPQCLSTDANTPLDPLTNSGHLQRSDQHVSTQHATTYVADALQLALAADFYVSAVLWWQATVTSEAVSVMTNAEGAGTCK
jgi:hypothetical protein